MKYEDFSIANNLFLFVHISCRPHNQPDHWSVREHMEETAIVDWAAFSRIDLFLTGKQWKLSNIGKHWKTMEVFEHCFLRLKRLNPVLNHHSTNMVSVQNLTLLYIQCILYYTYLHCFALLFYIFRLGLKQLYPPVSNHCLRNFVNDSIENQIISNAVLFSIIPCV